MNQPEERAHLSAASWQSASTLNFLLYSFPSHSSLTAYSPIGLLRRPNAHDHTVQVADVDSVALAGIAQGIIDCRKMQRYS